MSRDWKDSEALLLDDGYTWECLNSKIRVTQIQVGTDGLAVVVTKNSKAHDCLTSPEVGGLTLAMLHWMFTDWTNEQLISHGLDLASVVPNDDGDGLKEWSDLSPACPE
ncbi:sphX, partial [Symbiodinium pilosum]